MINDTRRYITKVFTDLLEYSYIKLNWKLMTNLTKEGLHKFKIIKSNKGCGSQRSYYCDYLIII